MHRVFAALTLAFAACLLWIVVDADRGTPNVFVTWVRTIPYGDKLGHLGLFGLFALLVNAALRHRRLLPWLLTGSAVVAALAFVEELSQAWMPTRSFDIADLAADAMGIAFGNVVGLVVTRSQARIRVRSHPHE